MSKFNIENAFLILQWQIKHNQWFGRFANALNFNEKAEDLLFWKWPYISVDAFKKIDGFLCGDTNNIGAIFMSSGTSEQSERAKHYIRDLALYRSYSLQAFYQKYPKEEYAVVAYLPAYSDNPNSSLVQMMQFIIEDDPTNTNSFLNLQKPTISTELLQQLKKQHKRLVLFGAAFGLVDLAEKKALKIPSDSIIIETGGMKTHRKEMTRDQIKSVLAQGFDIPYANIHSEYGMCELLSQAYEQGDGWYECPPWMMVFARPFNKPFAEPIINELGQLYVIDLANEHSCSFLQLNDQGIVNEQGKFQVLGRIPSAELRGCNYLMEQN